MNARKIIITLFALCLTTVVQAALIQSPQEIAATVTKAETYYAQGQYNEALALYMQLETVAYESASTLYNRANIHLKRDEVGYAIGYYSQALALSPRDEDIRYNLTYAKKQSQDRQEEQIDPLKEALFFWHRLVSPRETRLLAFCFLALVALFGSCWITNRLPRVAKRATILATLAAFALYVSWVIKYQDTVQPAGGVLTVTEASVRSAPGYSYTKLFTLHDGATFEIEEIRNGWLKVTVDNNHQGWLPREQIMLYPVY